MNFNRYAVIFTDHSRHGDLIVIVRPSPTRQHGDRTRDFVLDSVSRASKQRLSSVMKRGIPSLEDDGITVWIARTQQTPER